MPNIISLDQIRKFVDTTMSNVAISESLHEITSADGYQCNVRCWRPKSPAVSKVIILHGVVSHSDWLRPIAERLANHRVEVICPDRRGAGLNHQARGDAPNIETLISDVDLIRNEFSVPGVPMHLAGFCWGATYAIRCIEKSQAAYRSLILLAPSLFPAADIGSRIIEMGPSDVASETPLVPTDRFTSGPAYDEYIVPDTLRTKAVSPRFNAIMAQMTSMIPIRWAKLTVPCLMVLAENDRLADNDKHVQAFARLKTLEKKMTTLHSEHGLQFDAPEETAHAVISWLECAN